MASIKKNFVFSSILTTANYFFPFIIYPYVSRVLGVTNIGICNFVDSIIQYFILFSMMGMSILGIREIAIHKYDSKLSQTFSALLTLNGIFTLILSLLLVVVTLHIPFFAPYKPFLFIGLIKLIGNYFLIDWFYKGLEEFKYISIRTVCVRTIFCLLIFLFVKDQNDAKYFYLLSACMILFNAMLNIVYSRNFVQFHINFHFSKYIIPFITLGIYSFLTSMYTSFNISYLGFVNGNQEVGYYTTSTKLISIILSVYTAFTGVMMPRMSSLLSIGAEDKFYNYLSRSMSLLLSLSIPIVYWMIGSSRHIINVIAGEGYEGAIIPMMILSPLILIIGMEQLLIVQTLTPLKLDREILINSFFGALLSIVLNIIIVPKLGSVGSSLSWISSELAVFCSALYFVIKKIELTFPLKRMILLLIIYLPLLFLLHIIDKMGVNSYVFILLSVLASCLSFIAVSFTIDRDSELVKQFSKLVNL